MDCSSQAKFDPPIYYGAKHILWSYKGRNYAPTGTITCAKTYKRGLDSAVRQRGEFGSDRASTCTNPGRSRDPATLPNKRL